MSASAGSTGVAIGVDVGRQLTKVVVLAAGGRHDVLVPSPPANSRGIDTGSDRIVDAVRTALGDCDTQAAGERHVVLTVPLPPPSPERAAPATLASHLAAALGTGSAHQVDLARCVAAGASAPAGVRVVCDVGAHTLTAALCAEDSAGLRLLDQEVVSDLSERGTERFLRALADASTVPGTAKAGQLVRRAEVVLDRAAGNPRYRRTPIFGDTPAGFTAEAARQVLQPIASAAAEAVSRLLTRAWEPPDGATLVLAGGFGNLNPVRTAVSAVAARFGVTGQIVSGVTGAAYGAARVAAGTARLQPRSPRSLRLQGRRVRAGLLENIDIPLAVAGAAPLRAVGDGKAPLTVTVDESDASTGVPVQVLDAGTGRWHNLPGQVIHLAAGAYRVSLRPGSSPLGLLAFDPVDGGTAALVSLREPVDGGRV